jgi:hypothetical protein
LIVHTPCDNRGVEGSGPTRAIWITRRLTTVRHIRGLAQGLEEAGALDYAQVEIVSIDDSRGAELPDGRVITIDTLPAEGVLWVQSD